MIYTYKCISNTSAIIGFTPNKYYNLDTDEEIFLNDKNENYYNLTNESESIKNWDFLNARFVGPINTNKKITFKQKGNKVIAKMGNSTGVAKCSPEDEFDYYTGCRIALDRLFGRKSNIENVTKTNGKNISVGDTVRIVDSGKVYPTYQDFFINNKLDVGLLSRYQYGSHNIDYIGVHYTVKYIGKHDSQPFTLYVIEEKDGMNRVYLIGEEGIEKINKIYPIQNII